MSNNIGYDKIKITSFSIISININILNANNVEFVTTTDSINGFKVLDTATNGFVYIKTLRLKQNVEGNIIDFIIKKDEKGFRKTNLYINIPRIIYNNNIMNCSNKNDFVRALDIVKQELAYIGIIIFLEDAHINLMEININIDLKNDFHEYANVLDFISTNTSFKGNRAKFDNNYSFLNTGFTLETKKYKLKFYNKSKEQNIDGNLLRIELTYKDADIISKKFNTTKLDYFTNSIETVQADFINFINKYIVNAINKKTLEQQKQVLRIAKEIKQNNSKGWVSNFISVLKNSSIDNNIKILDENEIWEVVKALDRVNFARNKKNNLKHIPQAWSNKNIEKLEEILCNF